LQDHKGICPRLMFQRCSEPWSKVHSPPGTLFHCVCNIRFLKEICTFVLRTGSWIIKHVGPFTEFWLLVVFLYYSHAFIRIALSFLTHSLITMVSLPPWNIKLFSADQDFLKLLICFLKNEGD
jgi:hypothetical protein